MSQIANHTPIPNPAHDHTTRHRITRNGSTMKPQNTSNLPARQTSATQPPTTALTRSTDQIANHWPIPDPVCTTPPVNRPPTAIITQPQNTNTSATLRRRSTDTPAIRQPTPADQIGNHIPTSGPVPNPSNTNSNRDASCRQLLTARSCLQTWTKDRDRWNHCHSSYWSSSDCYRSSADSAAD